MVWAGEDTSQLRGTLTPWALSRLGTWHHKAGQLKVVREVEEKALFGIAIHQATLAGPQISIGTVLADEERLTAR
jgi:hypothetical protein